MRIATGSNCSIHIYPRDHPPPHCHVRFSDGTEVLVDLPLIQVRFGKEISDEVRRLIEDKLDTICDLFDQWHPGK